MSAISELSIHAEPATAAALMPFGDLIAVDAGDTGRDVPDYNARIWKPADFASDADTTLSTVRLDRRPFAIRWLERHFKHTQVFLPLNGKPFIVALAPPTEGDMPDPGSVRAFRFDGSQGVCMKVGTWHEFPFPLEDDTHAIVILRNETNRNLQQRSGTDAYGDDLDKKDVQIRWGQTLVVEP